MAQFIQNFVSCDLNLLIWRDILHRIAADYRGALN